MSRPEDPRREPKAALRDAATRLARELVELKEHPAIDELVDYQERRLDGKTDARIQHHLSICADCAADVESLAGLDAEREEDMSLAPDPGSTAEDWQRLQRRLAEPVRETEAGPAQAWLLAAAVATLALAAAFLLYRWGSDPRPDREKVADQPFLVDLFAETESVQRSGRAQTVIPPAGTDLFILRLVLNDLTIHDAYRAEIVGADEASRFTAEALRRQPTGEIVLVVPADRLGPGGYVLELLAASDAGWRRFESFSFEITPVDP